MLKEWNKSYQGNLVLRKTNLLGKLVEWEIILDKRPLNDEQKLREAYEDNNDIPIEIPQVGSREVVYVDHTSISWR